MIRKLVKLLALLVALAMAAGCFISFAAADSAAEDGMESYRTGSPWLCSVLDGVLTEEIVENTSLKDDFYTAVNGEKLLGLEFAEGYSSAGTVEDLQLISDERITTLFTDRMENPSHDAQLAYNLYDLLMDWDSRNEIGVSCLRPVIEKIEALESIADYYNYLITTDFSTRSGDIVYGVSDTLLEDSNIKCISVSVTGLLLGDSAEYSQLTPLGNTMKDVYSNLAEKILVKLGYSEEEALKKIENTFAFETILAPYIYTSVEEQSPDYLEKINNIYTREGLTELAGSFPILEVIETAEGFPAQEQYLVYVPEAVAALDDILTDENLPLLKDWITVTYVLENASNMDRESYEWVCEASNMISGAEGILPDEVVFSANVSSFLEWPVARLYTDTYCSQADKDRIIEMILRIKDKYGEIISAADFLSDETKAAAIDKLATITPYALFPDDWSKYEMDGLEILSPSEGGTLFEALEKITRYRNAKAVKEFSEPVDKNLWAGTPQTVNCYYYAPNNSVCILAGMAAGEMYRSDMTDEELYATLGVIIGHEISHAFDSSGAQFDKNGDMVMWWTEEDYAAFLEKNEKMVEYFDSMCPWEGQDFYGSIMTGEACADMGGVKVMLAIAAEDEDFDYDLFFRTNANLWCTKSTLMDVYEDLTDVHPLRYLRVNAVFQQFDEFLDFYGIEEGDGMYLAPEDRVNIW